MFAVSEFAEYENENSKLDRTTEQERYQMSDACDTTCTHSVLLGEIMASVNSPFVLRRPRPMDPCEATQSDPSLQAAAVPVNWNAGMIINELKVHCAGCKSVPGRLIVHAMHRNKKDSWKFKRN